jgi:hypothetical protein
MNNVAYGYAVPDALIIFNDQRTVVPVDIDCSSEHRFHAGIYAHTLADGCEKTSSVVGNSGKKRLDFTGCRGVHASDAIEPACRKRNEKLVEQVFMTYVGRLLVEPYAASRNIRGQLLGSVHVEPDADYDR